MKILIIIPGLNVGGSQKSLLSFIGSVSSVAKQIDLVSINGAHPAVLKQLPSNVSVHVLRSRSSSPLLWFRLLTMILYHRPNIIMGWSTYANLVAILVSRFSPAATVIISERNHLPRIFQRGSMPESLRRGILFLVKRMYPFADVITSNSEDSLRFVARFVRGPSRYVLLPNSVDLPAIAILAEGEASWPINVCPRILAVGRLDPQKGFDILIRAFSILIESRRDWELFIIGGGPEERALRRLSEELGISHRVSFLGEITNPYPYIATADMIVVPSRYEGFPNVVLEAFALRRAVVCSKFQSGAREITDSGRLAWVVPVGDAVALANAIIDAGDAPAERKRLGEAGWNFVKTRYDIKVQCRSYLALIGLVTN